MMRAPVAHAAAAIFAVMPPLRKIFGHATRTQNGIVSALRRRAEPQVPVQSRFRRFFRQIAKDRGTAHRRVHFGDRADHAVAHQLARGAKFTHRTLHRADLKNSFVRAHGAHHRAALVDGVRHRFFAVNILARIRRRDRGERVPVVGRGDDHSVNVLARQQIAEIVVGIAAFVVSAFFLFGVGGFDFVLGQIAAGRIHIAHRQHANVATRQASAEQAVALFANANETERDLHARRRVRGEQTGAQHQRRGTGNDGCFQKMAARKGTK